VCVCVCVCISLYSLLGNSVVLALGPLSFLSRATPRLLLIKGPVHHRKPVAVLVHGFWGHSLWLWGQLCVGFAISVGGFWLCWWPRPL